MSYQNLREQLVSLTVELDVIIISLLYEINFTLMPNFPPRIVRNFVKSLKTE